MADAFPLSGQIDPRSFPFLLARLHLQGATGSLKVEGPSYQKALYFRTGRILFGSSNDPRDQLGAILIEAGRITPEQLEDVNGKVGPGNPLAKVLADTGYVTQRELSEAARAKVERILSDLIAYAAGNFEFEDGVLPKGAVDLKLSTPRVILAAVRRVADRSFVLRHLDLETVLAPTADLPTHLPEIAAETGGLLDHIDGRRTLKEAAASTRLDEFEAAKIGSALLFLNYLDEATAPVEAGEVNLGQDDVAPFAFDQDDEAPVATESMPVPDFSTEQTQILTEPPRFDVEAEAAPAEPDAPFFDAADDAPDFQISDPAAYAPAPEPPAEEPEPIVADASEIGGTPLDATLMMGTAPSFAHEEPAETLVQQPAPDLDTMPVPEPAPEPEPEPVVIPTGRPARPSKDDLAALDAILNPQKGADLRPLSESAPTRTFVPRPMPRPQAEPSRRPLVLGLIGASVLVLGGAAVWFLLLSPPSVTTPPAPPQSITVAPSVEPPPPGAGAVEPVPVPGAADATTPPITVAPPSTVAATPPTTMRAAPPAPPAPSGDIAAARSALAAGRLDEATRGFGAAVRSAPAGSATLQLLVACSAETIQKAVAAGAAADLVVVPVDHRGRACYRVSWGIYPSAGAATSAMSSVPAYFRNEGVKARVVTIAEITR